MGDALVAALFEAELIAQALFNTKDWEDVALEVALDSGCTDNVCHEGDAPGYSIVESPGSKCG